MKFKEIEVDNKKVYLKKNFFNEYRVVYPCKTEGKINWKNLFIGSWENFIILILVILFIFYAINLYQEDIEKCAEIIERDSAIINNHPIDFSNVTLKIKEPYLIENEIK